MNPAPLTTRFGGEIPAGRDPQPLTNRIRRQAVISRWIVRRPSDGKELPVTFIDKDSAERSAMLMSLDKAERWRAYEVRGGKVVTR